MSTHPTDPSNDSFDDSPTEHNDPTAGFSPAEAQAITHALLQMESRVLHSEPIVRDLNRALTDVLGSCPCTDDGVWVTLDQDGSVQFHLELADVLRLSTAFQKIDCELSLEDVRRSLPSRQSLLQTLEASVKASSHGRSRESVHIAARRNNRLFKKGW